MDELPAASLELKVASIYYYQVYGKELPRLDYSNQDIQYVISQLKEALITGVNSFDHQHLH